MSKEILALLVFVAACGSGLPDVNDAGSDAGLDATIPIDTGTMPDGAGDASDDSDGAAVVDSGFDTGVSASAPWGFPLAVTPPIEGNVVVDANKNVIAAFAISQSLVVQSLDSTGNPKWKKQVSGPFPYDIAVDAQGAVYVVGYSYVTFDFGGGNVSQGGWLVKYDTSGNYVWHRGGFNGAWVNAVGVKSNGNVVFGGDFTGSVNFGGGNLVATYDDPFLVELTSGGSWVRNKNWAGGSATFSGMTFDGSNNFYGVGWLEGTVNFGGNNLTGPNTGSSTWNYFITKLDNTFAHVASKDLKTSGGGPLEFQTVSVAPNGNIGIGGAFTGTIDVGGGTLTSQGQGDIFIATLSSSLTHVWSKRFGDSYDQNMRGVAFDPNGNLGAAGNYRGGTNLNFGKGALPSGQSGEGIYLALFDSSGNCSASYGSFTNNEACEVWGMRYLSSPDFALMGGFNTKCALPSGTLMNTGAYVARLAP